jgi:hypothetical protein
VIAAVLSICFAVNPSQCVMQQFRIEPAACRLRSYRAEAPVDGEWRAVVVKVKCGGRAPQRRPHP